MAHKSDVNCVSFNPVYPNMLASASDDGLIKLWSIWYLINDSLIADLTHFVNIYFQSKDIGELMITNKNTAMLYFLYNPDLVSVLVCHDIPKGEFVLQVPYFPPF